MISTLLVSHNKPEYVYAAINSVLNQTHQDFELLIMDSGVLYDQGFFDKSLNVIRSNETEEIRKTKAMAPWCFNQLLDMAKGELITYLCDDDSLYPNALKTFNDFMTRNECNACYASIDLAFLEGNNQHVYGQRKALEIGGLDGYKMDCRVDSLQLCHRRNLGIYWTEDKESERHADGVFMEKIGRNNYIYPIPIKVGVNNRTPISTYYKM